MNYVGVDYHKKYSYMVVKNEVELNVTILLYYSYSLDRRPAMINTEQIKIVKERRTTELLNKANVVGVAVGLKEKGGQKTDRPSVVVMVRRKMSLSDLKKQDIVPSEIDRVSTDVKAVGEIRALNQTPKDRWRPAPGGVSIGHYGITAGTLGAVVRDANTNEKLILSNNHVLANSNAGEIGDAILQPGPYDGGTLQEDTIAHLLRFVPILFTQEPPDCPISTSVASMVNLLARASASRHRLVAVRLQPQPNQVDAALARPVEPDMVSYEILQIGQIVGTREAELGLAVRKSGRTTGLTSGAIELLDATVSVSFGAGRTALFEGQIVTTAMSQGGDSGSLLVHATENVAVGLLFAGSDQTTIHNPIDAVMSALNLRFQ